MAEVDVSKIKYNCVAVLSGGGQINLENIATNLAWEENESELSQRLNLTVRDVENGGRLSQQLALCTAIVLYYDLGNGSGPQEAMRGTVWDWQHSEVNDDDVVLTVYDMLHYLEKSEDYKFYEAGKSTSTITSDILTSWGVPVGEFSGPNITHEKMVLKTKKLAVMIKEVMEEAREKAGTKYVIRAKNGKCDIIRQGTNSQIWTFSSDVSLIASSDKYSMDDLITQVKIFGKDDEDGAKRPSVLAVETGAKQYGTLQKVLYVGSSTIDEAKAEASSILSQYGKPKRSIVLRSPDLPCIRKGDKIRAIADKMDGYFHVLGVSHNATSRQMQMEVEPA